MPVRFKTVLFWNRTGITKQVIIEAPIGKNQQTKTVEHDSSVTFDVLINDCPSVLIIAGDPEDETKQTFAMAPAQSGYPLYLESVEVEHYEGSITGSVIARTESVPRG